MGLGYAVAALDPLRPSFPVVLALSSSLTNGLIWRVPLTLRAYRTSKTPQGTNA